MSDSILDPRELRNVFGTFVTGVTVVTTRDRAGRLFGLTANSFTSVSLDPPLVLWSQSIWAPSYAAFRAAERFAVSILAEDQHDISARFARSATDKFAGVETDEGLGGIPLIRNACAHLECLKVNSFPGGDHAVFLGRVERMSRTARRPLVFAGGRYMVAYPHDLGGPPADPSAGALSTLRAVRLGSSVAAELAGELGTTVAVGVWGTHGPTVVRWEESVRPVSATLRTGAVLPVLRSAIGQVFGAFLPRAMTEPVLNGEILEDGGPAVLFDREDGSAPLVRMGRAEAEARLVEVRQRGLARNIDLRPAEDDPGKLAVFAAPVFDAAGTVVLSLAVLMPAAECRDGWDAAPVVALARAADALSAKLGHAGGR